MTALARIVLTVLVAFVAIGAKADPGQLREKYAQLREPLRHNPYHRPIYIDSAESDYDFDDEEEVCRRLPRIYAKFPEMGD